MRTTLKMLLCSMLLASASVAMADDPTAQMPAEFSVSGLTTLVGQKLKEAKGSTVVDFYGHTGAGLYLPVWTFHDNPKTQDYFEFPNIGYRAIQGSRPGMFLSSAANLTAISGWVWRSQWAKDHVERSPFPPVFFGPTILVPLDSRQISRMRWDNWRGWTGVVLSIRLN